MSAAVYHEPYRLPAGLLAVAVHGAFFALLYFGFSWQTQPAATMSVELWQGIPVEPVAVPSRPVVKEAAPPEPQEAVKPEIVLPDKKKVEVKPLPKSAAKKRDTSIVDRQYKLEQAARAERAAAKGRVVDQYTARIAAKIRSHIVMPPGVADDARAEFSVTVLPGGSVLLPRLVKSSGNVAYDNAVERAIFKAQPLPLPPDAALFNEFRELKLGFQPKE